MLPTAALAAEDEPQDGGAPIVCTELEGCTEDTHDESCPSDRNRRPPCGGADGVRRGVPLLRSGWS